MTVQIDRWVPAADGHYSATRFGTRLDAIVYHSTVGTMQQTLNTFTGGSRKVSAHFVIGLDGEVVQMVGLDDTAHHAGNWPWNMRSVGLEFVDDGNHADTLRTVEQYAAGVELSRALIREYAPNEGMHLRDHRELVATACPSGLDTDYLDAAALRGDDVTFDPRSRPADLAFLDARIRELILGEPQLTGSALRRALAQHYAAPAPRKSRSGVPSSAAVRRGHGAGRRPKGAQR